MGGVVECVHVKSEVRWRLIEGLDELVDDKGIKHDWRKDLVDQLAKTQKANGSWANEQDRWMEGDANLVTAFALLALGNAKK